MLLRLFTLLAAGLQKFVWVLKVLAIICFLTPVIMIAVSSAGVEGAGSYIALPGVGVFIWGLTICVSWFHPETGTMNIDDEDTASNFRMIMRSVSTVLMALYFLTGVALAVGPLTW